MPRKQNSGGIVLPAQLVALAQARDSLDTAQGGTEKEQGVSAMIRRIEGRAVQELSCYVRACMMRTGFECKE
jgi:hypothetical protein